MADEKNGKKVTFGDVAGEDEEKEASFMHNGDEQKELEEQIVEELYRIFTHKAD